MSSEDVSARLLSPAEIKEHGLDPSGTYLISFIINDKQNQAADPSPFKIAKSFLSKIAETVVGRPFILEPPDPTKHVRGGDNVEAILNYQRQFASGEFVKTFINGASGNVWGIGRIFPELAAGIKEKFKQKKIPPFTSPLVAMRKFNEAGEVIDGEILHIQAVSTAGYGEVAKVVGMCDGMLSKCMSELRVMGASGTLTEYRQKHFNEKPDKVPPNEILRLSMAEMTPDQLKALINESVSGALTAFETKHAKIFGAAGGVAAPQVETEKPASASPTAAAPATESVNDKPTGFDITKDPAYLAQADELKKLKDWQANTLAEQAKNKRMSEAKVIAKAEALRKEIAADKVDERVQELFDMKASDGKTPIDLSFTAQREEKALEKIAGASGYGPSQRMPMPAGTSRKVGFGDLEGEMM